MDIGKLDPGERRSLSKNEPIRGAAEHVEHRAIAIPLGVEVFSEENRIGWFDDKTEFFVLDDLHPQGLYNAARNVEIAVWKLSNARTPQGELYLLSNDGAGPVQNLSFEREFGKVIASLDVLSKIVADKENRTVIKMIQSVTTAVFLPIK